MKKVDSKHVLPVNNCTFETQIIHDENFTFPVAFT